jgi:hypothetical protein
MGFDGIGIGIETASGEEGIGGGKRNPFVAIHERTIVGKRLHQRSGLFRQAVVTVILGTKNSSLKSSSIPKPVKSAEFIDQLTVHLFDFGDREINVLGHLPGQHPQQLAISFLRFTEGTHGFRPDHLLRGNDIMEIVFQCAFEQEPLRLPSFPGNGDEFLMELGNYFWSKLHRLDLYRTTVLLLQSNR